MKGSERDPVVGGRVDKKPGLSEHGTKGTRPTVFKTWIYSESDQYPRETMHVRQSTGSKVSSFDVITGHPVRFLVTLYAKHCEVSHQITCCC